MTAEQSGPALDISPETPSSVSALCLCSSIPAERKREKHYLTKHQSHFLHTSVSSAARLSRAGHRKRLQEREERHPRRGHGEEGGGLSCDLSCLPELLSCPKLLVARKQNMAIR